MRVIIAQVLVLFSLTSFAQKFKTFRKLPPAEKIWVITHPFVAGKAYKISFEAKSAADSIAKDTTLLDGDGNGGQVDAFRHAYWMARLSSEIGWRRAKSLGDAHEKGNYWQYKKGIKEDGALPDKQSSDMDFLNNDIGRDIGMEYKDVSRDSLKKIIVKMILDGELWILWKNKKGKFLDCDGNIIPDSLLYHKWETPKCLVPSDTKRKP
jgi:hypothetical protein